MISQEQEPVAWQYGDSWDMPVGVDFAWWSETKIAEQKARWKCVRPLYLSPSVCEGKVTEEMVERAAKAMSAAWGSQSNYFDVLARAALTAALQNADILNAEYEINFMDSRESK